MRQINQNCLNLIREFMKLPQEVEVVDTQGRFLRNATIMFDGTVVANGITYAHPSHMRDTLIKSDAPTYKHFRYKGRLLSDWGVGPKSTGINYNDKG